MVLDNQVSSEDQEMTQEEPRIITLEVLRLIKEAQQKHGLRHGDFQRYRNYCSRRIRRLRCALHFMQGTKNRYNPKNVSDELLLKTGDLRYPCIILMQAERCWGYAMQDRQECTSEPRKKFHMRQRLRKALQYADGLSALCGSSAACDARTKLECQAYAAFMRGSYLFERNKWKEAMDAYSTAQTIYEKLGSALNEDERELYQQRVDEITPNLRYCAYNIGDQSAIKDLKKLRREGKGGMDNLDALIAQTRSKQAVTLKEVTWLGRTLPVRHEKVRLLLVFWDECCQELKQCEVADERVAIYERFLMELKDCLQVVKEEVKAQEANKIVETAGLSTLQYLHSYVTYLRLRATVDRNAAMIEMLRSKNNKPRDMVRPYEVILQCLQEMQQLPGVESRSEFYKDIENEIQLQRAFRAYYISKALTGLGKYPEALAMALRAEEYSSNAKPPVDKNAVKLHTDMRKQIEGEMYFVHAQSILGGEATAHEVTEEKRDKDPRPLIDRLDEYIEDPDLLTERNQTQLVSYPPDFEPTPCKPLFFDLAFNHVTFPDLTHEMEARKDTQQGAGLTGLVKGWLGGWK
ncbi:signal recognition particle 68 kDa protein-like [Tropilaelaps mercedesae]|uniref:Signal recognition particle subunit SRP68 n=1 Tax=Tropilaelaps mercedesae TaxID=418985 RepID=A0A1V9XF26_9ACAR|nr:signal recognition particle 68 kDa protein-like [Tropilaelaps mercedesae]